MPDLSAISECRARKGCGVESIHGWAPLPPEHHNGDLGAQSYIQQCIHENPEDIATICRLPDSYWTPNIWQYEQLRQVAMELSQLVILLHEVCTKELCPQMKATDEWVFLCAAHRVPSECCAIDYITHTLEGTTAVLNSSRWFPRRGVDPAEDATKVFHSIARRMHRIFAHVYYHHLDIFQQFEMERHLCKRFQFLVAEYGWIKGDGLKIDCT